MILSKTTSLNIVFLKLHLPQEDCDRLDLSVIYKKFVREDILLEDKEHLFKISVHFDKYIFSAVLRFEQNFKIVAMKTIYVFVVIIVV